jgi:hypothetical protein
VHAAQYNLELEANHYSYASCVFFSCISVEQGCRPLDCHLDDGNDGGISIWVIIGSVVGAVVFIGLVVGAACACCCRRRRTTRKPNPKTIPVHKASFPEESFRPCGSSPGSPISSRLPNDSHDMMMDNNVNHHYLHSEPHVRGEYPLSPQDYNRGPPSDGVAANNNNRYPHTPSSSDVAYKHQLSLSKPGPFHHHPEEAEEENYDVSSANRYMPTTKDQCRSVVRDLHNGGGATVFVQATPMTVMAEPIAIDSKIVSHPSPNITSTGSSSHTTSSSALSSSRRYRVPVDP